MEEKEKIIQEMEKDNKRVILKNDINNKENINNNKYIYEIKKKNEQIIKENTENKKIIEKLRREIYTKTKIIEDNKKVKCPNCSNNNKINNNNNSSAADKTLIEKLRKEIYSKNKIIMDHKTQINELLTEDDNNKKIINNLKNEISSKERIIKDYKEKYQKILNEKKNSNGMSIYRGGQNINNQEKQVILHDYEVIKETHIKEISRFKELNKDTDLITIKNEGGNRNNYRNYSFIKNGNETNEYQKIINDLRKENTQLNLKVKDYEKLKAEIDIYKNGRNISYKETNKTSLKSAHDALVEENKRLKEKIDKLQKNRY